MTDRQLVERIVRLARHILTSREGADGFSRRHRRRIAEDLLRIAMSVSEALRVLELPTSRKPTDEQIKKKYRELAFKNHPDRGGDSETMKLINDAHDTLTKGGSPREMRRRRYERRPPETPEERKRKEEEFRKREEERKRRDEENQKILEKVLDEQQKELQQVLKKLGASLPNHLKGLIEVKGRLKGKVRRSISFGRGWLSIEFNVPIEGGSIHGYAHTNIEAWKPEDITYFYETSFYLNRKENRVQRGRYNTTKDVKDLANPDFMVPLKRVKTILKRAQPGGVMKRKDFLSALERELDADIDYRGKDIWARIPLGGDRKLLLFRNTFMGQAAWGINGVYEGHKRVERPSYKSFPESEQGLDEIAKYVRTLK